jgi:predicted RNase H-like nuclease
MWKGNSSFILNKLTTDDFLDVLVVKLKRKLSTSAGFGIVPNLS